MNFLLHDLHCFKASPVGGIGYDLTLSKSELAMLQLLLSPDKESFEHWKNFWKEVVDYELAPFGCKELMPLAIRKMQKVVTQNDWQSVVPSHASFLAGLPKYAWSKNKVILAQCEKLANQLHQKGIEVMAIKGVAEMIRIPESMLMRTSRDIDLLIQPKDLEVSVELFKSQGWYSNQVIHGVPRPLSEFEGNSFTFDHPNYPVSLDIHFDAVSDGRGQYADFTTELWSNKLSAPCNSSIYIPSSEDRFCLFLANAFVPDNWTSGLVNKYLYDLLFQLRDMSNHDIELAKVKANKYLKLGEAVDQIILLDQKIAKHHYSQNQIALAKLNTKNRLKRGIQVSEERYYYFWHSHNYYQSVISKTRKKYGPIFSWIYLFCDFIFNTRPIQVVYWRFITLKDRLIDRIQYYPKRAVFHAQRFILNIVHIKGESTVNQCVQASYHQNISIIDPRDKKDVGEKDSENVLTDISPQPDLGSQLPLGMTRSFYLSGNIFKFSECAEEA